MYTNDLATAASAGFNTLWNGMNNGDPKNKEAINTLQRGVILKTTNFLYVY